MSLIIPTYFPILFDTNLYKWEEHQVTKVTFKSDLCHQNRCIVTGKQALKLPQGTDICQGLFTIQYQENNLRRALDFRIPDDLESETVDTITVSIPETAE
ncbi:MAG: hypothetical protein QNJ72_45185 [Pleurocapsa sp. MO_226.B13]|nr:hypothetical protein [Pleurocapsa sp. MO_226.B13]